MSTTEVKSNLAKLLATENLTVEHTNVPTASFNVETRILYLPTWDNITNEIYDLLVGHEVGHALYTPSDYSLDNDFPRSYLNVVEDARIERKMKQKYPGLVKSFFSGYTELNDRDFFEIADIDVSKMLLIDRINLHFKIGIHNVSTIIPFQEDEKQFVDMTAASETFTDVVEVCEKIAEFVRSKKEEQQEKIDEVDVDKSQTPSDSGNTVDIEDLQKNQTETEDQFDSEFDDIDDDNYGGDSDDFDDEEELEGSSTDQAWSRNQRKLIDEECLQRLYLTPPQVNWSDFITTIDEFSSDIDNALGDMSKKHSFFSMSLESWKNDYLNFKKESNKSVSYLIKEFEMKKRAEEYARSSVAKTGVVDTNKLFSYRWSEDIFKKTSIVPTGKNHGLIMYVDWSGSMSNSLLGTVKQLINLIVFCKKVNIPFQVFAFTDRGGHDYYDTSTSKTNNEIAVYKRFCLFEMFNSDIKGSEFEIQIMRVWNLTKMIIYSGFDGDYRKYELGSTPLNDTIFAGIEIFNKFKKRHRVDKVNTVFLTDGESNHLQFNRVIDATDDREEYVSRRTVGYYTESHNVCIKDPKTGYVDTNITNGQVWSSIGYSVTCSLIDYYKWMTGSKVIGFRLANNLGELRYLMRAIRDDDEINESAYRKKWKNDKFFVVSEYGYDELFILENGSGFNNEENSIQVNQGDTKNKIRNQFRKYVKTKMLNKVVLSKFVDQIA
jgi:hypothetical protein